MINQINGYILNLEPNQIVDRDDYVKQIRDILQKQDTSNILVIVARTATGKSSLVTKALSDTNIVQTIIRIRTLPLNSSEKTDEWDFFNNIFNAIKEKFLEDNVFSFESYINSFKNMPNNKAILTYIIDNMFNNMSNMHPVMPIIYLSASWYLKLGRFDINYLTDDNSVQSRRIKYQYVKYVLTHKSILIAIDNIQNADKQSLHDIINLINETKDCVVKFIFEFTISEERPLDYCQLLCDNFSATSVKTELMNLKSLDKRYILDAVSRHLKSITTDWNFSIKLQEEYEKKNSGNIREMLDFSICYSKAKDKNTTEYTFENIITLPEPAKVLLAFVVNCNGVMDWDILKEIESCIHLDVNEALSILKNKLIVEEDDSKIKLSHASLADQWDRCNKFENYNNIAYNTLQRFYNAIIETSKETTSKYDNAWLNLIQLYSKYDSHKLIEVFEFLDKDCKKVISPKNSWNYIAQMIAVTEGNPSEYLNLYLDFIRFCFESELYNEGYSIVEILMSHNYLNIRNKLILYKAMYLSALDKHDENIIYCEKNIQNFEVDSREYYNLKLISLSSYRSLGMLDECYKIHKEFINNPTFKKQYEWGYFLRLCEMYLDKKKSPRFVKKSIGYFEKRGDLIQAGKSLISYSYIIASQGKLKLAARKINLAQSYLKDMRMGNHMFLVNKAAIQLLLGNYKEEVWEMLSEAEITATVPFDRLAVINNKLVWCIENDNLNRHSLLIKNAYDLLQVEPDFHIHGITYYNIYYLLKLQNNPECEKYLIKAREMKKYCKPVQARLDNIITPETKFALTKPWHVCFLAYWTYDLKF